MMMRGEATKHMVLQKATDNSMDRTSEQVLKKMSTKRQNQKQTAGIYQTHNENDGFGKLCFCGYIEDKRDNESFGHLRGCVNGGWNGREIRNASNDHGAQDVVKSHDRSRPVETRDI